MFGLVAAGHAGDLDVADVRQPAADLGGEVALHHLRVVEIELHAQVGHGHFLADRVRVGLVVEQVARHVARVDRLDQHGDALLRRLLAGEAQVALVRAQPARPFVGVRGVGHHARHHVQARTAERMRVAQAGHDARRELVLAPRQRRETAIAGGEIARRRVDQHHLEVVLLHPRDDLLDLELVAERKLHGTKARLRRFAEALQERHLVEHERQVGAEARHTARKRSRRDASCAAKFVRTTRPGG